MPDVSNLKVGQNTYNIKDTTARTSAQTAQNTADTANTNAEHAITLATETDDKLTNTTLIGDYTTETETLEYKLQIGIGG